MVKSKAGIDSQVSDHVRNQDSILMWPERHCQIPQNCPLRTEEAVRCIHKTRLVG